jgi:hypothetical protein
MASTDSTLCVLPLQSLLPTIVERTLTPLYGAADVLLLVAPPPIEHWARLLAEHHFFRDPDFVQAEGEQPAAWVSVLFRRGSGGLAHHIVVPTNGVCGS